MRVFEILVTLAMLIKVTNCQIARQYTNINECLSHYQRNLKALKKSRLESGSQCREDDLKCLNSEAKYYETENQKLHDLLGSCMKDDCDEVFSHSKEGTLDDLLKRKYCNQFLGHYENNGKVKDEFNENEKFTTTHGWPSEPTVFTTTSETETTTAAADTTDMEYTFSTDTTSDPSETATYLAAKAFDNSSTMTPEKLSSLTKSSSGRNSIIQTKSNADTDKTLLWSTTTGTLEVKSAETKTTFQKESTIRIGFLTSPSTSHISPSALTTSVPNTDFSILSTLRSITKSITTENGSSTTGITTPSEATIFDISTEAETSSDNSMFAFATVTNISEPTTLVTSKLSMIQNETSSYLTESASTTISTETSTAATTFKDYETTCADLVSGENSKSDFSDSSHSKTEQDETDESSFCDTDETDESSSGETDDDSGSSSSDSFQSGTEADYSSEYETSKEESWDTMFEKSSKSGVLDSTNDDVSPKQKQEKIVPRILQTVKRTLSFGIQTTFGILNNICSSITNLGNRFSVGG